MLSESTTNDGIDISIVYRVVTTEIGLHFSDLLYYFIIALSG